MSDFFRDGGWGMWPTLLFGFLLVVAAGSYAFRPTLKQLGPVLGLGFVTFGSSVLGTTQGLIATTRFFARYEEADGVRILAMGFAESCNNLELGFVFLVLAGLVTTVGLWRASRQPA